MKYVLLLVVLYFACAQAADTEYGYARILGGTADAGIVGDVYFVKLNDTFVRVYASISGITQNDNAEHGMHVHEFGDIFYPTSNATGDHYVGAGVATHGCYPSDTRHEGDMGNWQVTSGAVNQWKDLDLLALSGDASIIGRAVVFHQNTDDCANTASSSTRLARGVIGVGNPAFFPAAALETTFTGNNVAANSGSPAAFTTGKAVCYLVPNQGYTVNGTVFFQVYSDVVVVTAEVFGLAYNTDHGIHIHEFGDLTFNNGTSVGGHYNPLNKDHGLPPAENRHLGDMGSICSFDSAGTGYYQYNNTLLVTGSTTTANIIGRAVVIHDRADDGSTNYGARMAQCVIGIANGNTFSPVVPDTVTPAAPNCGAAAGTTTGDVSTTGAGTTTGDLSTTGGNAATTSSGGASTTGDSSSASTLSTGAALFTVCCAVVLSWFL